ncbi:MAG: phosphotransferase [Anaerolineaceae bacterium]|nr:phosphotransferase [Anaerolineaceae bacterium]
MDPKIKELYHPRILKELASRYGLSTSQLHESGGFESYIYSFEHTGSEYILRVSHSIHRTPDQIQGEVEWINYVIDHGVSAARAVTSFTGKLVEIVPAEEGCFSGVIFEKLPGGHARGDDWQPALLEQIGELLGKMHAATKTFEPSAPQFRRIEWFQDPYLADMPGYLSGEDEVILQKFNQINDYLHTLPKSTDDYGLIHFDVHGGNFFLHEGVVRLFDFDDCMYNWFANDIAIALFYALPHRCDTPEQVEMARAYFLSLLKGYRRYNQLDPRWFKEVGTFLKLREIDLYALITGCIPVDEWDGWVDSYMNGRRERILNDRPFVDLDFYALSLNGAE